MDAARLATLLESEFGGRVDLHPRSSKRLYLDVEPSDLVPVVSWLRANLTGLRLGTSTVLDLREGIGVFHHFALNGAALIVTVKVLAAKPEPVVPSLTPLMPAASWIEREMHDMAGVHFEGHPDLRRLIKAAAYPRVYPLRREFDTRSFKESIGERPEF